MTVILTDEEIREACMGYVRARVPGMEPKLAALSVVPKTDAAGRSNGYTITAIVDVEPVRVPAVGVRVDR